VSSADPALRGNLADLVRAAADRAPDRPALVQGDVVLSWGELDARVDAAAAGLLAAGLRAGDRVGICLPNVLDFPVACFGVLRADLVAVPLNPGGTAEELRWTLGDSGASAVVVSADGRPAVQELVSGDDRLPELEHVLVSGGSWQDLLSGSSPAQRRSARRRGEDLAVLLYTSGTSGRPKGAMLSHRALLANLEQTARISPPVVGPDDVVLLVLPLFHVYGLNAALGAVVHAAATGVLVERFDPAQTLVEIRRTAVTTVVGAPPMYVAWSGLPELREAFGAVRLALSGAAPLPAAVLRRVLEVTGRYVHEGYGLTETAPVLTSTLMSGTAKPGSIGRPVPGVALRLLDEAGRRVEEGDPGEIVVRGDNLFSGYWPDGADGPDADGWFATGDVAYADDEGDLHLVDRRQDLVLVSGFNVYPKEVEDVLVRHPEVAEAAVLGVPHPLTGEAVRALVVRVPGSRLTAEDLLAHAARSLARFKCPSVVEFVPDLPRSVTGKVRKGRLRDALSS
jgi:long-chain acyl-CoA synthetase